MLAAGRLRHRITIERDRGETDADGQRIAAWQPFITNEPAEIRGLSGREYFLAQQAQSTATHTVTIRYRPGLDSRMRIRWCEGGTDRILNIGSIVDQDGRGRVLTILCSEDV